jgi:sugar phosphate isomerase/epimerase
MKKDNSGCREVIEMNRRSALKAMLATASAVATSAGASRGRTETAAGESGKQHVKSALGLVAYCLSIQRRVSKRLDASMEMFEPRRFLEAGHKLGAGGIQVSLGVRDADYCERLRQMADQLEMYIEGILAPPHQESEVARFAAEVETAARAGVKAVRTVIIPGRRYEFFDSLKKFREFDERGRRALERAAPIAEKHQVPLAVENHKDHRIEERVALLKHIDSQYVGACLDTGNNLALLEDPVEVAEALAPWAKSVHLKDQAVREYEEGFLLGDVPLGQGCIDLKTIVTIIRGQCPEVEFSLELITRDALQVPCLGDKYWATFPEVPASDLANTLAMIRCRSAEKLQQVSALSPEEQVALEMENVTNSLKYAREELGI